MQCKIQLSAKNMHMCRPLCMYNYVWMRMYMYVFLFKTKTHIFTRVTFFLWHGDNYIMQCKIQLSAKNISCTYKHLRFLAYTIQTYRKIDKIDENVVHNISMSVCMHVYLCNVFMPTYYIIMCVCLSKYVFT